MDTNLEPVKTTPDDGKMQNVRKKLTPKRNKKNKDNVESPSSPETPLVTVLGGNKFPVDVIDDLASEYIFPLKKKNARFTNALFFCRLCDYHCEDLQHCRQHSKDARHQRLIAIRESDAFLKVLPEPTHTHAETLTNLLEDMYSQKSETAKGYVLRERAVTRITEFIASISPDTEVRLYGSTFCRVALIDSDVNLDLAVSANAAATMTLIYSKMKEDKTELFLSVRSHFSDKVPKVCFIVYGLQCVLTVNNVGAVKTSELLSLYVAVDERCKKLCVVLRLWAKLCRVDKQEEGTLPAYCYALFACFFLQRCDSSPVLPVLTVVKSEDNSDREVEATIDDLEAEILAFESKNAQSLGLLWIKLLKFYSLDFDVGANVISLRVPPIQVMARSEKKWASKRFAIEDPYSRRRNIARCISHTQVFEYIYCRFRDSYSYFAVPRNKSGPLVSKKLGDSNENGRVGLASVGEMTSQTMTDSADLVEGAKSKASVHSLLSDAAKLLPKSCDKIPSLIEELDVGDESSSKDRRDLNNDFIAAIEKICLDDEGDEQPNNTTKTEAVSKLLKKSRSLPAEHADRFELAFRALEEKEAEMTPEQRRSLYAFEFNEAVLYDGRGPAIMCALCQRCGHLKTNCPDEALPRLEPLQPLTKEYEYHLNNSLLQVPRDFEPNAEDNQMRLDVLSELKNYLASFYPGLTLTLFGSSVNGFGFSQSDLDICMTFTNVDPETLEFIPIVEEVASLLRKHRSFYNVLAITSAKVPIVKFKHRRTNIDGDISLYNLLAYRNTKMLQLYSSLDDRVKVLGYIMKVFAKLCEIGDASRGSLSSYAYIIMVLYYLQQRNPPVIPVLQELYNGKKPEIIVDGWNAWYYSDMRNLSRVWPEHGRNRESVAQLWVGLLRFYTEEFSLNDHVVCMRQRRLLTRFDKMWNGRGLAIEDPFDLSHNLGGGLSRKMVKFIMEAFINGRKLFGTSISHLPHGYNTLLDYLFDVNLLTTSEPPNDRACRICGKIGHFAKECSVVLARKDRKKQGPDSPQAKSPPAKANGAETPGRQQPKSHSPSPRAPAKGKSPSVGAGAHQRATPENTRQATGNTAENTTPRSAKGRKQQQHPKEDRGASAKAPPTTHQKSPRAKLTPRQRKQREKKQSPDQSTSSPQVGVPPGVTAAYSAARATPTAEDVPFLVALGPNMAQGSPGRPSPAATAVTSLTVPRGDGVAGPPGSAIDITKLFEAHRQAAAAGHVTRFPVGPRVPGSPAGPRAGSLVTPVQTQIPVCAPTPMGPPAQRMRSPRPTSNFVTVPAVQPPASAHPTQLNLPVYHKQN